MGSKVKTWSFLSEATGQPIGRRFTGHVDSLAANTPAGCRAVEGIHRRAPDERHAARQRILALEQQQHRRVRELLAATDPKLAEIEAAIEAERVKL
jgi:hypothetical protein